MASKKKIAVKRQVWNKGLQIGKRDGFTPAQVKRFRSVLRDRGIAGVRDLALFSTAIDTMRTDITCSRLLSETYRVGMVQSVHLLR